MRRFPRPGSVTVMTFAIAAVYGWGAREPVASGSPDSVTLLAPKGSRFAADLRREIVASGFAVVSIDSSGADWRADARRLPGNHRIHGVVVGADERTITVFTRRGPADIIEAHWEQAVEPGDRMARRRASLGAVEVLRALSETDPPSSGDMDSWHSAQPPGARESPAGLAPRSPMAPAHPSGIAVAPRSSAAGAAPSPPPGASAAPESTATPLSPRSDGSPGSPPGKPALGVGETAVATAMSDRPVAPGETTHLESSQPASVRFWALGVGSTLELQAAPGGPTVHLQFLWYLPLEWRLALCVRALWPVLGGQFRTDGNDVRTWTFTGAASLQYLFGSEGERLRPFVGTALGARLTLTETTPTSAPQSWERFTPSVTLGADAGVRYVHSARVQFFAEAGVVHGWLVPGVNRVSYEAAGANSDSLHASFGVLFEI